MCPANHPIGNIAIKSQCQMIHFVEIYLEKHWTKRIVHIVLCDCEMCARDFIDATSLNESRYIQM